MARSITGIDWRYGMRQVDEAQISFGQLSVVRDLEGIHEARWREAVVHSRISLPAGTGLEVASRAWRVVQMRHPVLRTTFRLCGEVSLLRQTVWDEVFQTGLPSIQVGTEEFDAFCRSAVRDPLDCGSPAFWRAGVVGAGGAAPFVLLLHNHLLSDRHAEGILRGDLAAAVEGRALGPAPGPADVARRERHPDRARSNDRTLAHWDACLSAGSPGRPAADPALPPVEYRITSATVWKNVNSICAQVGTAPSTVVLAAFVRALGPPRGPGLHHLLQVMAANRQLPHHAGVVTTANQWAIASLRWEAELVDQIGVVAAATLAAYRFGSYDVDTISELAVGYGNPGGVLPTTAAYNFGHLSAAEAARSGALEIVDRSEPVHGIGHPLYLKVSAGDAILSLGLRGVGMPDAEVRDLFHATLDGLT